MSGMFDELDVYEDSEWRDASLNMAIDEALLKTATKPGLRFYGWKGPSLSFGYFGRYADAAREGGSRDLVRRWTGGGIVLHGNDLTYSLVIPASCRSFALPPGAIYAAVHQAMRDVLVAEGKAALIATSARPKISEACFANAVVADVLLGENKVAGAAQRRTRSGLLQQGSIQIPQLSAAFAENFARALCSANCVRNFAPDLARRAEEMAETKYATDVWLRRR
jgi:lipoyl(octanoyl) transferase